MMYVPYVCRSSKQPEYKTIIVNGKKVKELNPNYCDFIWIDKDLLNSKNNPPTWKYCRECCSKLGINYDKQTPTSNLSKKELNNRNKMLERLAKARNKKIDSEYVEGG